MDQGPEDFGGPSTPCNYQTPERIGLGGRLFIYIEGLLFTKGTVNEMWDV